MTSHLDLSGASEPVRRAQDVDAPNKDTQLAAPSAFTAPRRATGPTGSRWERRYSLVVVLNDFIAVVGVVVLAQILGLGDFAPTFGGRISPALGIVVTILTAGCLMMTRAWDQRVLGQGSEEFTRLIKAFVTSAVLLGLASLALQLAALRPWVFGLLPLAGLLSLLGRFGLRKWLHANRSKGRFVHPALVVGTPESAAELIARARRDPYNGWEVRGVCTPTGMGINNQPYVLGVPVVGDLDAVATVARDGEFRIVSVCTTPGWAPRRLHQLAWDLEGLNADLVVDPGLMEIAGPRLHVSPVDGFPMLRLTAPSFDGISRVIKSAIDWVSALLLVIVIAPLLFALAVAVSFDGGPVFFRQERVGKHGRTFKMIKFRSMVVDAEKRRAELLAGNEGAGPMFKMRNDPRITRVGSTLRKYSLDELPQLFNVLAGSMSLVGPRPPLPAEVLTYSRDAERKLMVKPGLTGLWQVSGRSDLSWEESVRLDMRYVENWTLAMDALILWKTIGILGRGSGAY